MRILRPVVALLIVAGCATAPPATEPPLSPTPVVGPPPSVTPTATPMPTVVPTVPPPSAMPATDIDPPLIRVLLERSTDPVQLPQPGRPYRLSFEDRSLWMWGPLTLRVAGSGSRWWQVGAWSEPANAAAAAATVRRAFGATVDVQEVLGADLRTGTA